MKQTDRRHWHHVIRARACPPDDPDCSALFDLFLRSADAQATGAVDHRHPHELARPHYHSGPLGPGGYPLGFSRSREADVAPEAVTPSDDAKVRVWDDRLRH
ncbi:MAG: hypothetical protein ACYDCL_21435 [Myxococcales bacterium]